MFTKIWNWIKGEDEVFTIRKFNNGFAIVDRQGFVASKMYTRKRDAVRGATRKGLVIG